MDKVLEVIGVILLAIAISLMWAQRSAMKLEEDISLKEVQIETVLQHKADLIPNLVTIVKEYEKHEKEIFTAVDNARTNLVKSIGKRDLSAMHLSNAELTDALSNLIAISEDYPELKSNQQFIALIDELAGTENRITIARQNYNEAVSKYNLRIKRFPENILLSLIDFTPIEYFKVADESKEAPAISF